MTDPFPVDPWWYARPRSTSTSSAQTESVFALVQRPHRPARQPRRGRAARAARHLPELACYELRPLPYAEAGYGYPESGQTVINVTNGKLIRLLVDDEPFDVRYGELRSHERVPRPARGTLRARRASGARRPGTQCG